MSGRIGSLALVALLSAGVSGVALRAAGAAPSRTSQRSAASAEASAMSVCPVQAPPAYETTVAYAPFQLVAPGVGWEWSAQDQLLWTTDGGAVWRDITPPAGPLGPESGGPASACFLNQSDGWVAVPGEQPGSTSTAGPAGVVWRTTDGGVTWQPAPLPIALATAVPSRLQLDFVNALDGYLLFEPATPLGAPSHPTLLRTIDGGVAWSLVPFVVRHGPGTGPMRFLSASDGWSHEPELVTTDDGGVSWHPVQLPGVPVGCHPTAGLPAFWSATEGVLPVTYGATGGRARCDQVGRPAHLMLYVTANGGQTWSVRSSRPYSPVDAGTVPRLAVVTADDWAVVVGPPNWPHRGHPPRAIVWWTHDGGRQWSTVRPRGLWLYFLADSAEFQFATTIEGWAFGCPPLGPCKVFATADGGRSWRALPPGPLLTTSSPTPTPITPVPAVPVLGACPYPSGGYGAAPFQMLSETAGWLWSATDHLLWTADGGRTWHDISPPTAITSQEALTSSVCFVNHRDGWVAVPAAAAAPPTHGGAGVIWRTTDGGQRWRPAALSTTLAHGTAFIFQLNFVNPRDGWLMDQTPSPGMGAPSPAYLFRTSDGGVHWRQVRWPPDGAGLDSLRFYAPTLGAAVGRALSITRDGGRAWVRARLPLPAGAFGCALSAGLPQFWSAQDGVVAVAFSTPVVATVRGSAPCAIQADRVALYSTTDGGVTWGLSALVATANFSLSLPTLLAIDPTDWALVAGGIVLETQDRGAHWSFIIPEGMPAAGGAVIQFADPRVGWSSGCGGAVQPCGAVYATTDGGQTWQPLPVTLPPARG